MYMIAHIIQQHTTDDANSRCGNLGKGRRARAASDLVHWIHRTYTLKTKMLDLGRVRCFG